MTALWSRDFDENAGRQESERMDYVPDRDMIELARLREENAALRRAERRDLAQIEGALDRDDTLAAAMRRVREENERLRAELAQREKPCECGQGLRLFDAREQRWEILMADRSENFDEVDMYQPVGAPCPYCGHRLEAPTDGV